MTITPLSQRNPAWASLMLGTAPKVSRITIGSDGCALVSACMLGNYLTGKNYTPKTLNEELNRRGGYAKNRQGYKCLIIWQKVAEIYGIKYLGSRTYNNIKASWIIYGKRLPLIVEGSAPTIGAVQHFRLFIGGQKQNDPWTGATISTKVYNARSYREFSR